MPTPTTSPTSTTDQDKPRRAGGRPRSTDPRTMRGIRMTAREWATFQALGGSDWFAQAMARAKLTPEQRARRDGLMQQGLDLETSAAPK